MAEQENKTKRGSYAKSSAGKVRKAYQVAMKRRAVSLLMEQVIML